MNVPCKKLIILILFKLVSLSLLADPLDVIREQEEAINWEVIKKAYDEYLIYPSTENAHKLYETLPKEDIGRLEVEGRDVRKYIYENYQLLAYQMLAGDRNAVKVAFRLFNISDADFTESIDSTLGQLIRIHPKLFLEELELHKNVYFVQEVDYPLFGTHPSFIDRDKAEELELELRVKALESVEDKELRTIRDECINQLRDYIKKYR
jgi:hypothetical protein